MKNRIVTTAVLVAAASAWSVAPASADIIFERIGGGTGNNVLFQCPTGDVVCEGELTDGDDFLIGTIQNTTYQVGFDADVNIQPGASGQATIEEVDSSTLWTSLDLSWLNFDSTDLVILRIKPVSDDTTITLTACDNLGDCSWTSSPDFTGVDAPQGDFFRVRAINGQRIVSVGVEATNGSLSEVEQVRLGDIFDGDDVIPSPEPSMLALFGIGLCGAGARLRRKR